MIGFFIVAALLWATVEGPRVFWGAVCAVTDRLTWWAHARYGAAVREAA